MCSGTQFTREHVRSRQRQATAWFESENGSYIYRNTGDGRWWIDGPSGAGTLCLTPRAPHYRTKSAQRGFRPTRNPSTSWFNVPPAILTVPFCTWVSAGIKPILGRDSSVNMPFQAKQIFLQRKTLRASIFDSLHTPDSLHACSSAKVDIPFRKLILFWQAMFRGIVQAMLHK